MLLRDSIRALRVRWHHPATWLGAFVLPALVVIPSANLRLPGLSPDFPWQEITVTLAVYWVLSILILALPVQWTGDERPQAGPLRAFLQWGLLQTTLLAGITWLEARGLEGRQLGIYLGFVVAFAFSGNLFLGILAWVVAKAETQEREIQDAESRAQAAEQMVARGSFNPRILFESLQGLLLERDVQVLERGLVDLAVLFRTQLVAQSQDMIPFREERNHAELLLKVLAHGGRLQNQFHGQWDPAAEDRPFPALGFTRLLEASLRHPLHAGALTLRMGSRALPTGMEVELGWEGPDAEALAKTLQEGPEVEQLAQRLKGFSTLREPVTLEGGQGVWILTLRVVGVRL